MAAFVADGIVIKRVSAGGRILDAGGVAIEGGKPMAVLAKPVVLLASASSV